MSVKNRNSVVTDGLVFYVDASNPNSYPGSGTTWTDLIEGVNGTLTNGPTYNSGNGGYIDFDGSNDYVDVTGINVSTLSAFTVEAWVYPTSNSSDGTVFGNFGSNTSTRSFLLYWDVGDGALGFDWLVATSAFYRTGPTVANGSLNAWNHVVGTCSGSQIQLYVNGSSIGTASVSGTINNNSGFRLGATQEPGLRALNGNIAVAKVYDKVLSSAEVTQNYNALKNRFI